jgi:AcrR family transcriptional regulator
MSRVTDSTKKVITETALKMFVSNSISKVRLYDIANKANVGEATIYRHFGNKQNVVLAAAIDLSNKISVNYLRDDENKSGFELIKGFYETFLKIFKTTNYYSFLNELDSYLQEEEFQGRDKYQDNVESYRNLFMKDYEKGVNDGTLRQVPDIEVFYYSTTHSIVALCKKLSTKKILAQDEIIDKEKEIVVLINIFLNYLKK